MNRSISPPPPNTPGHTPRHLLLAWELGSGLGHQDGLLALARSAIANAWKVTAVVRELPSQAVCDAFPTIRWIHYPEPIAATGNNTTTFSFPQLLLALGVADRKALRRRVTSWMSFYELLQIDAVAVDHAPFALLAAHASGIPSLQIGTGFTVPPALDPMPVFRTWQPVANEQLQAAELAIAEALRVLREDIANTRHPFPRTMKEWLNGSIALRTLPCLDHYPSRPPGARYVGPVNETASASKQVNWPSREQFAKRAIVYLKDGQPQLQPVVAALAQTPECYSHIYVSGASAGARASELRNISISNEPFNFDRAMGECDIVISAGGAATTARSLLFGRPQLIAPTQAEQTIAALNVRRLGIGAALVQNDSVGIAHESIRGLLHNDEIAEKTRQLARDNAQFATGTDERLWVSLQDAMTSRSEAS